MSRFRMLFAMTMVIVLGLSPQMGLAATGKACVIVAAGDVQGTVSDATGKPMAGAAVNLLKDGKMVASAVSGKAGQFVLRGIAAGNYELLMPGMNPLPLKAADKGGLATLKVVLPIQKTYAAAGVSFSGFYDWVIVSFAEAPVVAGLVAVGVVTAIAVPIAANSGGSSGGDTISP